MVRRPEGRLSRSGHLDVLAAVPKALRESAVLARCERKRFHKGAIVWSQGDPAPSVGFLIEGKAVSEYHSPNGRSMITGLWFPGDLIGANNLGTYNLHEMTMRCLEPSLVYSLPVERFYALVRSHPDLATAVIKALSVRLHWYARLALIFGTQSVEERVCGTLLALAEHFSVETEDGLLIDLKLTHETLAAMVGVTRSFLTVTLSHLERRGLIRSRQRRIVIRKPKELEAMAFGDGREAEGRPGFGRSKLGAAR